MKNILNKYVYLSIFLALSVVISSCTDDENFGSDASKVIPLVTGIDGKTVTFIGESFTYTIAPYRGGSEYIWDVVGAQIEAVPGRPDQIKILFNQLGAVSVSVYEKAFNGSSSDAIDIDIYVFDTPCDWTLDMQDDWGDGWNGATVSFTFDGIDGGEYTLDDGEEDTVLIPVPNGAVVKVTYTAGEYDEEVTYQLYDGNGVLLLDEGFEPEIGEVLSMTNNCND